MILKRFFYAAVLFLCLPGIASSQNKGDKKNGNPIFAGWYADPEGIIYGDTFWVYPTLSLLYGEDVEKYGQDIQNEKQKGGIGVAVSDSPAGPYKDALGKPLIDKIINGAQPIDQFVFRDDDGSYYMYYGGWKHCNVVKLRSDLLGLEPFEDGTMYREVTPEQYVEGPFMLKRNGKYYFMWSEGGWGGPDYSVAYAIADSPMGPFKRIGKILQQDPQVATGAGHHSVIQIPGKDEYYIVYHRRPLDCNRINERQVCIDKMEFDENGYIKPVKITFEGVAPVKLTK